MAKKKVEEVKEKEEVVKEKKPRTKKSKTDEVKEEIKEEKVKRTRSKKTNVEEPKEAEEIVEAEKVVIKEEEKAEAIEVEAIETNEVTALAIFDNTEVEILKKMIAEYKARTNTNTNTSNSNEKAKNFFENIEIPQEVRKVEYNTTLSIRGKSEIYEKIKEVAKANGITASLLVNYLFYLVLKPLGKWEEAINDKK